MSIERKLEIIKEKILDLIYSKKYKEESCMKETDFTRKRKLTFIDNILIILRGSKKTMQASINMFIDEYKKEVDEYTKQAFSKGRKRIKAEAFLMIFKETVSGFYEDKKFRKYKGYRVSAIDGTDYNLPNNEELLKAFGSQKFGDKVQVQAQGSCLYDVLNGMLIDVSISPFNTNERELAMAHMDELANIKTEKELLLMDRGYPSRELINKCEKLGFKYLMRCNKDNFLSEVRNVKSDDEVVERKYEDTTLKMRVVTVKLDKTTKTLITNLPEEFTTEDLKYLYHLRWGIETFYNDAKNKMEIENFSGTSELAVKQDFYATMALSNIVASAEYDSQEELDCINKDKNLKHAYKINRAIAIGEVKRSFIEMLLEESPIKQVRIFNKILKRLTKNTVSIVKNREFNRQVNHPAIKYPINKKSVD